MSSNDNEIGRRLMTRPLGGIMPDALMPASSTEYAAHAKLALFRNRRNGMAASAKPCRQT
jgi:hypothetical protein